MFLPIDSATSSSLLNDEGGMTGQDVTKVNWRALWKTGALARFCFISLGVVFHAGGENMITTIMPSMVRDLGGVEYTGWTFAIYETGSIIAGAAAGRLSSHWTVRANIVLAALLFAIGCAATIAAPSMPWLLAGRLLSGFGGGALIALSLVAIRRYFPAAIWPQLLAILSVVWGVSAFGGPLYGGLIGTLLSWRWAFAILGLAALAFAMAVLFVLREEGPSPGNGRRLSFPASALLCLSAGVMAIAAAGVETRLLQFSLLFSGGVAAIALFFWMDARNPSSRLFPASTLDPRTTVGAGLMMVAALAVSTCSFAYYGSLLLAALHGFSPLKIGLIIASESVAWSILSILVANASARSEQAIVVGGALMIAAGIAGFAYTVPEGSVPLILLCALLQGGGFGILWPFASRRIVEAAPEGERDIAASAFSTLQRLGYAIGAAVAGMIANANGFSGGFTRVAAESAGSILFLAFLPLALFGCLAAWRMSLPNINNAEPALTQSPP
jgi:MFS family permease